MTPTLRFDDVSPTFSLAAVLDAVTRESNPLRPAVRLDARPVAPIPAPVPAIVQPAAVAPARKSASAPGLDYLATEVVKLRSVIASHEAAQAVRDRAMADATADLARQRAAQAGQARVARDGMIARRLAR